MGAILGLRLEFDCQDEMSGSEKDRLADDKDGAVTRTVPASGEVPLSIYMFHPRAYSGPPTRTHKCAIASWPSRLARSTRTM
jgi:hypothetical protein